MVAKSREVLIYVPCPVSRERDEGGHHCSQREVLLECKDTGHQELEDDNAPHEPGEGDGPRLTMRFIWFVKD